MELEGAAAPPRQSRKVVTALFCDVSGSTALGEELDPEVLRGVLNRYFEVIRGIIERHGGTVEKFIGDAVMAVFGIPRVHEDDALRAVRAAAEIRERLPVVAEEVGVALRFRTGVNTGAVLMGEGENLAIGDAVNVAARLEQAAEPGEIVLGEECLPRTLQLPRPRRRVTRIAKRPLAAASAASRHHGRLTARRFRQAVSKSSRSAWRPTTRQPAPSATIPSPRTYHPLNRPVHRSSSKAVARRRDPNRPDPAASTVALGTGGRIGRASCSDSATGHLGRDADCPAMRVACGPVGRD
ncbi:MAG: adenylate/guanylate cyclase domain-containing protein [Solirubrobacteraceae bacterium]